jgi:predicted RNA binding protein YcfA (HicA-like mRNA interferase family)
MTPRLPRDISGHHLAKALAAYGYKITRQTGSHLRLTTSINGEHHVTVPAHDHVKVGTLSGILAEVARHLELSKIEVSNRLFG